MQNVLKRSLAVALCVLMAFSIFSICEFTVVDSVSAASTNVKVPTADITGSLREVDPNADNYSFPEAKDFSGIINGDLDGFQRVLYNNSGTRSKPYKDSGDDHEHTGNTAFLQFQFAKDYHITKIDLQCATVDYVGGQSQNNYPVRAIQSTVMATRSTKGQGDEVFVDQSNMNRTLVEKGGNKYDPINTFTIDKNVGPTSGISLIMNFYGYGNEYTGIRSITFYTDSYTLSYNTDGSSSTQTKYRGQNIALKSAPSKTGYDFAGWKHTNGTTYAAGYNWTTDADASFTATWNIHSHALNVSSNNTTYGTVSGGGTYNYNTSHTITASPNSGYKFEGWSDGDKNATRTITMPDSDVNLTATFAPIKYDITVLSNNTTYGTVSGGGNYDYNSQQTITATANTGYHFEKWNDNDTNATRTITVPLNGATYTATFAPNTNTAYTVNHYKQLETGEYPGTPDDTDNLTGTTGADVTPDVKTYHGYIAPTPQTKTIAADGSTVVDYKYLVNTYNINYNLDGGEFGENHPTLVAYGASFGVSNPTKENYKFLGWQITGMDTVSVHEFSAGGVPTTNSLAEFFSPKENIHFRSLHSVMGATVTFTAVWEADSYTVTLNANGATIDPAKNVTSYSYGIGATLPTKDDMTYAGMVFKGWFTNAQFTGEAVTAIGADEVGNKEFFAKWISEEQDDFEKFVIAQKAIVNGLAPKDESAEANAARGEVIGDIDNIVSGQGSYEEKKDAILGIVAAAKTTIGMLDTYFQLPAGLTKESDVAAIRFLTTITNGDYFYEAGFDVTINGKTQRFTFDECYAEILGSSYEEQDGQPLALAASEFNAESDYFVTFVLYNIPKSFYGAEITVQAYAITYPDEVEIKGLTKTVTINGLIDAVA